MPVQRLQQFLDRLRLGHPKSPERAELYALLHRLRGERKEILSRIGEEVAVWHRAGGSSERLLTEELRADLANLGLVEEQLAACLPLLGPEAEVSLADGYLPSSSYLADADGAPTVIRAAGKPPPLPTPDPLG